MTTQTALAVLGLAIGLLGHAAFWIALANRLRSTGIPRWMTKLLGVSMEAIVVFTPLAVLVWPIGWPQMLDLQRLLQTIPGAYLLGCWVAAITLVPHWAWQRLSYRVPAALIQESSRNVNVEQALGHQPIAGLKAHLLRHVPGNQLLDLRIEEKTFAVAGLPAELDGLRIVHLSDLHLSGRLTIDYFHQVARHTRSLDADLLVITGDVCDKDTCAPWLSQAFAGVRARFGNYYVLGNHDLRLSSLGVVRNQLDSLGFIEVGGTCVQAMVHGERVLIAGNELPWIKPADDFERTLKREVPRSSFRLLLSHSPDQYPWAQKLGFDLVLAGHTHGGQIRFPLIGPVVCPSRFNVRYACGVFHEGKTLMHVSRGTASLFPFRLNCPPEISVIVLRQLTS